MYSTSKWSAPRPPGRMALLVMTPGAVSNHSDCTPSTTPLPRKRAKRSTTADQNGRKPHTSRCRLKPINSPPLAPDRTRLSGPGSSGRVTQADRSKRGVTHAVFEGRDVGRFPVAGAGHPQVLGRERHLREAAGEERRRAAVELPGRADHGE